ncbi:MAG: transcription elongation factor GreA [Chloroflexota bacterium]|jgi:transcription elongation factor GreA
MPHSAKKDSSSSLVSESNLTLSQAMGSYLSSLTQEERNALALDLNAFARWFGPQRPIQSITPPDLERYQEQLTGEARTGVTERLEALRTFLVVARRQRWINTNLAINIKLKRKKSTEQGHKSTTTDATKNGNQIRLTREGYQKLVEELNFLETEMRPKIAEELRIAAADKDFRENAPYDVAKQHQGEVEARIRELKRILENGQVVAEAGSANVIDLGSRVTLRDLDEDEEIVYELVGPGEIDPRHGKISIQSPVGKALTGKKVGDDVSVDVPAGTLRLRVEKVEER